LNSGEGMYPLATSISKDRGILHCSLDAEGLSWRWVDVPEIEGFILPAHGEALYDCGSLIVQKCPTPEKHYFTTLDGVTYSGEEYYDFKRRSCFRLECPHDYLDAVSRMASRVDKRIMAYAGLHGGKPIHVAIAPKPEFWYLPHEELKRRMLKVLKACGLKGGCYVFHHLRDDNDSGFWHWSPHWHVIGFGWIVWNRDLMDKFGFTVINLGVRKSVFATAWYELTHCGILKGCRKHNVVWFGCCSYRKLKVFEDDEDGEVKRSKCPVCGSGLVNVVNRNELIMLSKLFGVRLVVGVMGMKDGRYCYIPDKFALRGFLDGGFLVKDGVVKHV
jgi:hypothetical protein